MNLVPCQKELECHQHISKKNTSKKNSYIVGNKEFFGKIYILNLRNKRKSIFARLIIRN